jgi:hypothetical protein
VIFLLESRSGYLVTTIVLDSKLFTTHPLRLFLDLVDVRVRVQLTMKTFSLLSALQVRGLCFKSAGVPLHNC